MTGSHKNTLQKPSLFYLVSDVKWSSVLVCNCAICTLKYVHLLEICKMQLYYPNIYPFQKFVSLQKVCIPPGNLYPFRKFVSLQEISTPPGNFYLKICTPPGNLYTWRKFVPQNMYPSWKFVHQNEISQVVRTLTPILCTQELDLPLLVRSQVTQLNLF